MKKKQKLLIKSIWYFAYLIFIGPILFLSFIKWGSGSNIPEWIPTILAIATGGYWIYMIWDLKESKRVRDKTSYVKIRK